MTSRQRQLKQNPKQQENEQTSTPKESTRRSRAKQQKHEIAPPFAQLASRPITDLQQLPEYYQAGLHEWHSESYFPSLGIDTVEIFLGLIRSLPDQLAQEVGTSPESLIELYNAAIVSALPAMSSDEVDAVLGYTYATGAELLALPSESTSQLATEIPFELAGDAPAAASTSSPETEQEDSTAPGIILANLIDAHMPVIRDQGERGTCVAFATTAVMEYGYYQANDNHEDLSEQLLYWKTKKIDNYPNEGTWLNYAFELARRDGVCRESLWPYESNKVPGDLTHGEPPDGDACALDAKDYAFSRIIRLKNPRDVQSIKRQLQQGRPVAIAIPVFKTWYDNPASRLFGKITLPLKTDLFATGGHAIVLVGYVAASEQAADGYFIVRNSWGTIKWGTECPFGAGYGSIPFAYIERHNRDAWTGVMKDN